MVYTQRNRFISITTPLGEDVLLLQGFTGHEGMSRLFCFQLDVRSTDPTIAAAQMLGQPVTLSLRLAEGSLRYMHGFVSRFVHSGSDVHFTAYRAEVVPWLWFLTRSVDCRIFQRLTVPEIVKQVCNDLGFHDLTLRLQGQFEPLEYCVQYRETAFNFVSRLMAQAGIFYFFEHTKDRHTLVLANTATAHQPCPGQARARCDYAAGAVLEEDLIIGWHQAQEVRSGQYTLTDYNFETPCTDLTVDSPSTVRLGRHDTYEVYDYPGAYSDRTQGEALATLRMEAEEARHTVVRGTSTCRAFTPGTRFDLVGHDQQAMNTSYVLTTVRHVASVGHSYGTGAGAGTEAQYTNAFTCIPADVRYRPPRVATRPCVPGLQTAMVVGPKDEEVYTDTYGRVKVQFHWDRQGKRDENSSCWLRVAQPWAGKRWGAMFLPRVGQEVLVAFLEGDPDRPLITGQVYNAECLPPYELPAQKTQSGIKSRSTPGGSAESYNEWRFEDKKGVEELYLHAARDLRCLVTHDARLEVGNDQTVVVQRHRHDTISTGNACLTIAQGHRTVQLDMGNDTLTLKQGNQVTHVQLGRSTTEAMQAIELKVGASSLTIDQRGITLKGLLITIEGNALAQMKAPMTRINANGLLQLKGGLTMIG